MLNQMDRLEEIDKDINVLQAVDYIVDAWNNISTISIRNCFKKAGFSFASTEMEVAEVQVVDKDNAREEIEASCNMYCEENPHIKSTPLDNNISLNENLKTTTIRSTNS
jgi:hypothetical protein